MSIEGQNLFPPSPVSALKSKYVGKDVREVEGPAAILDIAVLKRNCDLMLETAEVLDVSFRAHIKTHKTVEVTRLQVGEAPKPVKLIVSTVAEAELILPYLIECKQQGRDINVIYGIPPSSTCFARLKPLRDALGPSSLSFLVDHPAQLQNLVPPSFSSSSTAADCVPVLIKTDTGYHRAGLSSDTPELSALISAISDAPHIVLHGFYSTNSHSYSGSDPASALSYLCVELSGVVAAAEYTLQHAAFASSANPPRFTLSIGATPTTTSAQNLLSPSSSSQLSAVDKASVAEVKQLITRTSHSHNVELHAGVYPTLDLQQLATHARPATLHSAGPSMTPADIGLVILAEVLSVYTGRERPEALIGAGSLALGREPCKAYPGWGVLAPDAWADGNAANQIVYDIDMAEDDRIGWTIGGVSQEHGIMVWQGPADRMKERPLSVGQRILLWPNHACIAGANFGWYLVVDSGAGEEGGATRIVDVWVRCRGW